jgi:hypothetical protein
MVRGPLSDGELAAMRGRLALYPDGRWARLLAEIEQHRASTALVEAERELAGLRALVEDAAWLVGEMSDDLCDAASEDDSAAARRWDIARSFLDRAGRAVVGGGAVELGPSRAACRAAV